MTTRRFAALATALALAPGLARTEPGPPPAPAGSSGGACSLDLVWPCAPGADGVFMVGAADDPTSPGVVALKSTGDRGVTLVGGLSLYYGIPGGFPDYQFHFMVPPGSLRAGAVYEVKPKSQAEAPDISIRSSGHADCLAGGRFRVAHLLYTPDAMLRELAVAFEQRCEGAAHPLCGCISYTRADPSPPGPAPVIVPPGVGARVGRWSVVRPEPILAALSAPLVTVRRARVGEVVTRLERIFKREDFLRVVFEDGTRGVIASVAIAPEAAQPVLRHAFRSLDLHPNPDLSGAPTGSLPANEPFAIAAGGAPGPEQSVAVLRDGHVAGFVDAAQLVVERPTADDIALLCRAELTSGRYYRAILCAEDAARLRPDDPRPPRLLAALLEAAGEWQAAREVRRALPPEPAPAAAAVPTDAPPLPRGWAVVAASMLSVRAAAASDGPVVDRLAAGAKVEVERVQGEWAEIAYRPAPLRRVLHDPFMIGGAGPIEEPLQPEPRRGFVSSRYLDHGLEPSKATRALAETLATQGRLAEAAAMMERAWSQDPGDRDLTRAVAGTAYDAGQWALAARAGWALAGPGALLAGVEVEALDLVYGCRGPLAGDRLGARTATAGCLLHAEVRRACPVSAADAVPPRDARLDERFPPPAYLRAVLRRRGAATGEIHVVAAVPPDVCEEHPTAVQPWRWGVPQGGIPLPAPGEVLELWIPVPTYAGMTYALVAAGQRVTTANSRDTLGDFLVARAARREHPVVGSGPAMRLIAAPSTPCCPP